MVLACLALGACAQSGGALDLASPATMPDPEAKEHADPTSALKAAGKEYAKDSRNPSKAVAYARALKAVGEKRQALAVLQQTSMFDAGDRNLNSEYGRLALELDQVALAERLLQAADDPAEPDWRVISARGTVLAKQGKYREAIPLYERALSLAPNQSSILNNLALAHAMEGSADKAEPLLKRAAAAGQDARVNQNLALVLGLQGKYDEARTVASRDLPPDTAAADVDYLRRIVMVQPRTMSRADVPTASIAKARPSTPELRGSTHEDATGWMPSVAAAPK